MIFSVFQGDCCAGATVRNPIESLIFTCRAYCGNVIESNLFFKGIGAINISKPDWIVNVILGRLDSHKYAFPPRQKKTCLERQALPEMQVPGVK